MLAFNEPYFTPGGWHEAKCVIGKSRSASNEFDIPDGIFCESFPVENRGIEKSDLVDSLMFQP